MEDNNHQDLADPADEKKLAMRPHVTSGGAASSAIIEARL